MNTADRLTISDLQEQHRQYAEVIGVENMLRLAESFGGSAFYIPKVSELWKHYKYTEILSQFNGTNAKKLAVQYGVSESTVYRLVRNSLQE